MKRAAIKGLIILAVVVLMCIFFSGTLHTITTAKVQMTKARTGKLETKVTLTGSLRWPEAEPLSIPGMTSEDTLTILRLPVSAGSHVRAGDLIAECEVNDYESRMETLEGSFDAKEKEYLELERKYWTPQQNSQRREQEWLSAYQRVKDAITAVYEVQQELRSAAQQAGIQMEEDALPKDLPEGEAGDALREIQARLEEARKEEENARLEFERTNRMGINEELVTYMDKRAELEKEMTELTERMAALRLLQESGTRLYAPHDGYITVSDMKAGDTVSRSTALVQITEEGMLPAIRLDASEARRTFAEGTAVALSAGGKTLETRTGTQGISSDGQIYIDIPLKTGDLAALGGVPAVSESGSVSAQISWKAETASTLIPTSALRGTSPDYYLYIARESQDSFGAVKYTTEEMKVTVLGQSGTVTSVEENLSGVNIVYMEDRTLANNMEVMLYSDQGQ